MHIFPLSSPEDDLFQMSLVGGCRIPEIVFRNLTPCFSVTPLAEYAIVSKRERESVCVCVQAWVYVRKTARYLYSAGKGLFKTKSPRKA